MRVESYKFDLCDIYMHGNLKVRLISNVRTIRLKPTLNYVSQQIKENFLLFPSLLHGW